MTESQLLAGIVNDFEQLSGAILSRDSKSMIIGLGTWANRDQWPLPWLKTVKRVKIFGIHVIEYMSVYIKDNFYDWKLMALVI